jgi:hypothetical protein
MNVNKHNTKRTIMMSINPLQGSGEREIILIITKKFILAICVDYVKSITANMNLMKEFQELFNITSGQPMRIFLGLEFIRSDASMRLDPDRSNVLISRHSGSSIRYLIVVISGKQIWYFAFQE